MYIKLKEFVRYWVGILLQYIPPQFYRKRTYYFTEDQKKARVEFNRKREWNFKPNKHGEVRHFANRRVAEKNLKIYVDWAMALLKCFLTRELEEGEVVNACALEMNPLNNEFLHGYLYPGDWLNISPVNNDKVPLNEVWVDLEKLITRR